MQVKQTKQGNICAFIKLNSDGLGCCYVLSERLLEDLRKDLKHFIDDTMRAVVVSVINLENSFEF